MEYRNLGQSGLKVSVLSFGAWVTFANQMGEKEAQACMATAFEAGVNFFDNAEVYADGQAEIIMGRVIKNLNWSRDSYIVSSKAFWGGSRPTQRGLSRKHLVEACHGALKRLQLDYLDLFYCHRPDVSTPIEETVRAMHELVLQGKILYWGTSEWSAAQIMEAHLQARQHHLTPPTMEQPQYNMLHRDKVEHDFIRLYEQVGLGLTTFSPLASGFLSGKYLEGVPNDSRFKLAGYDWLQSKYLGTEFSRTQSQLKALNQLAIDLDSTLPQLAIAWCAKNRYVSSVITGASRKSQVSENMKALDTLPKLSHEIMSQIDRILDNKPPSPPVF